jgi:uncharacterized protein (TIGR03118 family)
LVDPKDGPASLLRGARPVFINEYARSQKDCGDRGSHEISLEKKREDKVKFMQFWKLFSMVAAVILGLFIICKSTPAQVSGNTYLQTNLVADTSMASPTPLHVDPNLLNPWGIAFFPNNPFWISDNDSGLSTLYNQTGMLQGTFTIPPPNGSSAVATPTGIVANLSLTGFVVGGQPSQFIFDTEDGTISGWNGGATVILAVDNSMGGSGAVYKGLAMVTSNGANFILATNFRSGNVEVYDSKFAPTSLSGSFTDPNLPAGYAPFGIHNVGNNQIYVTYALQDSAKHDPVHAAGDGVVDIFDDNGNFVQRFISNGDMHTNAPWGVVIPPAGFGAFGGDVLVGNFGDGVLNAYSLSKTFVDSVRDAGGNVITNLSLWDLVFGGGGAAGDPNTLYLTAGGVNETHGIFASLAPTQASSGNAPAFSLSAAPSSATLTAGASATFTVHISPISGFNSPVSLSCSGLPAGARCMFSAQSYSGGAIPMLTITTTAPSAMKVSGVSGGPLSISGLTSQFGISLALGFVGLLLAALYSIKLPSRFGFPALVRAGGLAVILLSLFATAGCSGGNSRASAASTPSGTSTIIVTGTSGTLSSQTTISLMVN